MRVTAQLGHDDALGLVDHRTRLQRLLQLLREFRRAGVQLWCLTGEFRIRLAIDWGVSRVGPEVTVYAVLTG